MQATDVPVGLGLATQTQYSERADAYAAMGGLTWECVDLRHALASRGWSPETAPADASAAYYETRGKMLVQKERWLRAVAVVRKAESKDEAGPEPTQTTQTQCSKCGCRPGEGWPVPAGNGPTCGSHKARGASPPLVCDGVMETRS